MTAIREWISGICAVSLLTTILKSILPKNVLQKHFNLVSSLLLVVAVIAPISDMDFSEIKIDISQNENETMAIIETATTENSNIADEIIEREVTEYICKKTGADRESMTINCEEGEIRNAVLYSNNVQVINLLINDIGISRERITVGCK